MNFDLSELDKLSSKQTIEGRKKLPTILAKTKPKAVERDGVSGGAKTKVASGPSAKTDPGVALSVAKRNKESSDTTRDGRVQGTPRRASTRSTTKQGEHKDLDVFIPHKDMELLESMSGKRDTRGRKGRKTKDANVVPQTRTDGLEELHKALHLSTYDGIEDVSKVIQAEPLEDRKARMMAQHLTKKKRGRPRKMDKERVVTKKESCLVEKEVDDACHQRKVQKVGTREEDVTTLAIVKVEEHEDSKKHAMKKQNDSLADQQLDVENWSLKDIVKWGNARERKLAKEKAKDEPKSYDKPTPIQEKEPQPLHPKVHVKDGKIVVDKESLTVAAQQKEEYTKIVTEDSHSINSMSYVNRLSNDRWSIEDTELFFRALSQFGTDFTLIAQLFPGRQRKHLKKKFCKEGKVNASRIDAAMKASSHATINSYKEMITLLKQSGMNVGTSSHPRKAS